MREYRIPKAGLSVEEQRNSRESLIVTTEHNGHIE